MAVSRAERRAEKRTIDWRAATLAGLIAGAAFLGIELIFDLLALRGPLATQVRMTAAIVMGEGALAAGFNLPVILVALTIHLLLSITFAVILAWVILRLEFMAAEIVGLTFGLALYLVNYHGFAEIYPWFQDHRGWLPVVTHLVFGGLAALEYKAFANPRTERGA
jgi:tetrahydromethanopterin S-methyltransferase subunit E